MPLPAQPTSYLSATRSAGPDSTSATGTMPANRESFAAARLQVNVTSRHPSDILERAPLLPSLDEADTSERYEAKVAAMAAEEEARKAAEAEAEAKAAEEARKHAIQAAYLAAIPDGIKVRNTSIRRL